MNTPKVPIIIPVYNFESYIERCLLSALNQTYQNIEIILVDDCGQDNSMSVARRVAENHPNGHKIIFLKHEQNRGLSATRNTGINAATGDYVYFFDSDDEITLDCIETLVKPLEKQKFNIVIGNYRVTGTTKQFSSLILKQSMLTDNENIPHSFLKGDWYEMAN
jgi:glycosyltransferase involved in cell wall biosynthesis